MCAKLGSNSHIPFVWKLRPQFRFRLTRRSSVSEQRPHTPRVAGEIPAAATNILKFLRLALTRRGALHTDARRGASHCGPDYKQGSLSIGRGSLSVVEARQQREETPRTIKSQPLHPTSRVLPRPRAPEGAPARPACAGWASYSCAPARLPYLTGAH